MSNNRRAVISFSIMALMIAIVGFGQSWNVALAIVNLCLISAVMSMGLNMQWGFAGLFEWKNNTWLFVGVLLACLMPELWLLLQSEV